MKSAGRKTPCPSMGAPTRRTALVDRSDTYKSVGPEPSSALCQSTHHDDLAPVSFFSALLMVFLTFSFFFSESRDTFRMFPYDCMNLR